MIAIVYVNKVRAGKALAQDVRCEGCLQQYDQRTICFSARPEINVIAIMYVKSESRGGSFARCEGYLQQYDDDWIYGSFLDSTFL